MHNRALEYLKQWVDSDRRKPLLIRGARQVGKTYLAREIGKLKFEEIVEINFEKDPSAAELFDKADIQHTLKLIRSYTNKKLIPGKSLLLLDEIQARPEVLITLRYFYEELNALHVIATGSLLEFALAELEFSMPVGRIEYLYLGPVTFEEYLSFIGAENLYNYLQAFTLKEQLPLAIHQQLTKHFQEFLIVGGMPEAIHTYYQSADLNQVEKVKRSILDTYIEDFAKYRKRVDLGRLTNVFKNSIASIGKKYRYANVLAEDTADNIKRALSLLCQAQVYFKIKHSSGRGLPLAAGTKDNIFKVIFIDVGLVASLLGLKLEDVANISDNNTFNTDFIGAQAEQFIGQHLLYQQDLYQAPELYYWVREQKGSSAEVDYLQVHKLQVFPVEVKAGASGRLRSLSRFVVERNINFAIRYYYSAPAVEKVSLADSKHQFTLLSLPHYLVNQQKRLLKSLI